MACPPFNLRTDGLVGADPGGTWTNPGSTYSGSITGDDPSIDWNLLTPGLNTFTYSVSGCGGSPSTADVDLYLMDLGTVSNASITLCQTDSAVNLNTAMSIIIGSDGVGNWSGDITNPGWSAPNFDPSLSGVGTFVFTFTISPDVPGGYTDLMCCDPIAGTATITVTNSANAGSGGDFAGC